MSYRFIQFNVRFVHLSPNMHYVLSLTSPSQISRSATFASFLPPFLRVCVPVADYRTNFWGSGSGAPEEEIIQFCKRFGYRRGPDLRLITLFCSTVLLYAGSTKGPVEPLIHLWCVQTLHTAKLSGNGCLWPNVVIKLHAVGLALHYICIECRPIVLIVALVAFNVCQLVKSSGRSN